MKKMPTQSILLCMSTYAGKQIDDTIRAAIPASAFDAAGDAPEARGTDAKLRTPTESTCTVTMARMFLQL